MASGAVAAMSPRTAARQHPYGAPRPPRRPGAGVALRNLAPDLNREDLRFLFDRYGELTLAEVRGEEGALWYEDERDAAYVVAKLEGYMFAGRPLRLSLIRPEPPAAPLVVQAPPLFAPPPALGRTSNGAKLRILDLSDEAWARAVAAASAVAPPAYVGSFRDDFGKLAGVLDFATADEARRALAAVEAHGYRATVLEAGGSPSGPPPAAATAAPPQFGEGGARAVAASAARSRSLSRGRGAWRSQSRSSSSDEPRRGQRRSRSPSRRAGHRGRSRSRSPARDRRGRSRSPPRRMQRTPSPPPLPPPPPLTRFTPQGQPTPAWQSGPGGRMPYAPQQQAYAQPMWQAPPGRPPTPQMPPMPPMPQLQPQMYNMLYGRPPPPQQQQQQQGWDVYPQQRGPPPPPQQQHWGSRW